LSKTSRIMELEGVLNILGGWETKMKMIDQLKNTSHRQKKRPLGRNVPQCTVIRSRKAQMLACQDVHL
jgi:hypothetical protein